MRRGLISVPFEDSAIITFLLSLDSVLTLQSLSPPFYSGLKGNKIIVNPELLRVKRSHTKNICHSYWYFRTSTRPRIGQVITPLEYSAEAQGKVAPSSERSNDKTNPFTHVPDAHTTSMIVIWGGNKGFQLLVTLSRLPGLSNDGKAADCTQMVIFGTVRLLYPSEYEY